jgi:hypothetical protein
VRSAVDVRCGGCACATAVFGVVAVLGAVAVQAVVARHGASAARLLRSVKLARRGVCKRQFLRDVAITGYDGGVFR